jgi:hypothetical protein
LGTHGAERADDRCRDGYGVNASAPEAVGKVCELRALGGIGNDRRLLNSNRGVKRLRHQMDPVEQQGVRRLACGNRAEPGDEGFWRLVMVVTSALKNSTVVRWTYP